MKAYFFTVNQHHWRTGEIIGVTTGVVFADNEDSATEKAMDLACGNNSSKLCVWEVNEAEGCSYTAYRSSMN